ncbi:MAG: HWE histidine kinase domain-containing protein [Microcoleaceae cyanobacterium]
MVDFVSHSEVQKLALDNCDREPIHIPGEIQPFGALIATDLQLEQILHASANLESVLGVSTQEALGHDPSTVLSGKIVHDLNNTCGLSTIQTQRERVGSYKVHGKLFEISAHRSNERFVIEVEALDHSEEHRREPVSLVKSMMSQLQAQQDPQAMLENAVLSLRGMTGFDRVMAYKFLPEGEGEVVAEAVRSRYAPYLGLRYPASDIPKQYRAILLRMPIRVIPDIQLQPSPLLSLESEAPLDLSLTQLRAVSPIHVEYLENMGVRATMNVAIIVQSELWGLFAFHHHQPILVPPDFRAVCEIFGQVFSLKLQNAIEEERFQSRRRSKSTIGQFVSELQNIQQQDLVNLLQQHSPRLLQLVMADGLAIKYGETLTTEGAVPSTEAIHELIRQSQAYSESEVTTIENLSNVDFPPDVTLNQSAGAMILGIVPNEQFYLAFFRNEIIRQVRWAGSPEKEIKFGQFGPRLIPRASFEEYKESVANCSSPWTPANVSAALELRLGLLQFATSHNQLSQQAWIKQRQQHEMLIAELNHRVKNILALIRSVARQTKASASSITEYVTTLEQRITALASAHELAAGNQLEWPSLKRLISAEIKPYLSDINERVFMSDFEVSLKSDFALVFGLVLHELVSNSAKYGALSVPQGKVSIQWQGEDGGLGFLWREENGPIVQLPKRKGFGRTLIERAIPYEFDGEAQLSFDQSGVRAKFWIPNGYVLWRSRSPEQLLEQSSPSVADTSFYGAALVVEDNMLIAQDIEDILRNHGFETVDAVPRIKVALEELESKEHNYQIAFLDINLKGETSFELAEELMKRNIPFVFTTGYISKHAIPDPFRTKPLLKKPINEVVLISTIEKILKKGQQNVKIR